MKIKFWGVRGSIPTPLSSKTVRNKIKKILRKAIKNKVSTEEELTEFIADLDKSVYGTVGGNTACIEVTVNGKIFIFDMGSGLRSLGQYLYQNKQYKNKTFYIFLSHTHWDHISGFPFFYPAFFP